MSIRVHEEHVANWADPICSLTPVNPFKYSQWLNQPDIFDEIFLALAKLAKYLMEKC